MHAILDLITTEESGDGQQQQQGDWRSNPGQTYSPFNL